MAIAVEEMVRVRELSLLEKDERWAVEAWFYDEVVAIRGEEYAQRWFFPVPERN